MIKNKKGITLVSLSIAVIIILIITGMLIYSSLDSVYIKRLTNMYNDISNLRDKISTYYAEYGAIPAKTVYTSTGGVEEAFGANDTGDFYIIDLQALDGLTLNNGKDYEKYKENNDIDQTELKDIYIINENSHNIFYVQGVEVRQNDGVHTYYTDLEPDSEKVNLVEVEIPEEIKLLDEVIGNEVTNTKAQDNLKNIVWVPAGFKVVNPEENVTDGIIIEDVDESRATVGSQFVWIPVGTINTENGTETIELNRYTFDSTTGEETPQGENAINTYYQELSESTYGNTVAKNISDFKTSIEEHGGYYIGRYEARDGDTMEARTSDTSDANQLVCTEDDYVYNYITQPQAAELSRGMYDETEFTSDLVNSYAWDTAIVFLQTFDDRTTLTKVYSIQNSLNTGSVASQGTNKLTNTAQQDEICNIWDMASNCYEWSTETRIESRYSGVPCVIRGGSYNLIDIYTNYRSSSGPSATTTYGHTDYQSFRPILYLNIE